MSDRFPHQKLRVYRLAVELAVLGHELAGRLPRGARGLADQLTRSGPAVALLIAEGANRASSAQKRQRFVEARGECGEAVATVEVLARMGLLPVEDASHFEQQADAIAAMLTGLIRRHS